MPSPERLYRGSVRVMSLLFIVLGCAICVATIAAGGGPASAGLLMGLAFIGVGLARLWLSSRTDS